AGGGLARARAVDERGEPRARLVRGEIARDVKPIVDVPGARGEDAGALEEGRVGEGPREGLRGLAEERARERERVAGGGDAHRGVDREVEGRAGGRGERAGEEGGARGVREAAADQPAGREDDAIGGERIALLERRRPFAVRALDGRGARGDDGHAGL